MKIHVVDERVLAAADAEIEACERRRSRLKRLLRDVERRAEAARKATGNRMVRVREVAAVKVKVLDSFAKQLREVLE